MGSIGFAMPLLSTLAALVIIVHSAEEDYEREYHMLSPRSMNVETNYDQSWPKNQMGPVTQPPSIIHSETLDKTDPEQSMRRRRVRKRKRRPQSSEEDDFVPQQRIYTNNENPQIHLQENIERPRRRRKKMEFHNSNDKERESSWNEENRPKRRRGQKRKLSAGLFSELSEFGGYQERPDNIEKHIDNEKIQMHNENNYQKGIAEKVNSKVQIYDNESELEGTTQVMAVVKDENSRSLSEFSVESAMPIQNLNMTKIDVEAKIRDKGINLPSYIELSKDKEPLDSFTLKALLRKSNGKSLSEILQQNNLSLADLLHGREEALSILKDETLPKTIGQSRHSNTIYYNPGSFAENIEAFNEKEFSESEKLNENRHVEIETTTFLSTTAHINNYRENVQEDFNQERPVEIRRKGYLRRRFPGGIRRKLRTRPMENNTYKSQLSRDLIALTSIKYKNNRNVSKSREWKEIIPSMIEEDNFDAEPVTRMEPEIEVITTTPCTFTETTIQEIYDTTTDQTYSSIYTQSVGDSDSLQNTGDSKTTYLEIEGIDIAQFTSTPLDVNTEQDTEIITQKPKSTPIVKTLKNTSDLRRRALNNRLKRKRVKQRSSTTEIPEELLVKDTLENIGQFVSASEFITKSQTRTTENEDDFTTLEDFLTTETTQPRVLGRYRSKKPLITKNLTTFTVQAFVTTEETAKFEIEEILNDNHTSAKLSKILEERNMTLKELVEHRERGSSHVHLADIFHNASREPNPPEPFLSKSLIEPISKETYPLRALLEANLHDPRTTTIDPNEAQLNNANIPVVMDFGNNVNENGENNGIISLFNKYNKINIDESNSNNESARYSHENEVKSNFNNQEVGTTREIRMLNPEKAPVSWNDLINLMQQKHQKESSVNEILLPSDTPISETLKKINLEEDLDGDGVIVLDDLQKLSNMGRQRNTQRLLELNIYETNTPLQNTKSTNSNMVLNDTKSVTVATASIIGLALILFLLTYALLKWKQQNKIFHTKHAKEDEFVPSPVFESRKGHKINSSTRSKSPMLATSNIYSIDTIDTRAGSESPEYMWDTLRKPFQ